MKQPMARIARRVAWIAGAMAVLLGACGVWLLNRPTVPAAATAGRPPAVDMPPQRSIETRPEVTTEAKPEVPAASAVAAAPLKRPPVGPMDIDLRKVQLALEGHGSPEDAREAAKVLQICRGAEATVGMAYRLRDESDPSWREMEKRFGVSSKKFIEASEDTMRRCQVFDVATLGRRGELLKRAYEGGIKDVALDYLIWVSAESKQPIEPELLAKLQREARQSAEDGNLEALGVLSTGFNPKLGVTPVQWQAYKEARLLILTDISGPAMAAASRDEMDKLEKNLSQWIGLPQPLSAEEQREADALAERVVGAWRKHQASGG